MLRGKEGKDATESFPHIELDCIGEERGEKITQAEAADQHYHQTSNEISEAGNTISKQNTSR